jgi:7-cyano-7-deazaguanine synthase in queuosine biosynthesis
MNEIDKLQLLDNFLLNLRGFISKYPENKKAVVLFSGGMDSVVLAARLIIEHDITVFPVHIVRNQSNIKGEERAIKFFEQLYFDRFKDKFKPVKELKICLPPEIIKEPMKEYVVSNGYPCRDNIFSLYALYYSISLHPLYGNIHSIFTSAIPGGTYTHDTLAALRSSTILACNSTPFIDWNISSPNLDPILLGNENLVKKEDLVAWAHRHSIPIEHSHTCIVMGDYHCGECIFCNKRKKAFAVAGINDKTKYLI